MNSPALGNRKQSGYTVFTAPAKSSSIILNPTMPDLLVQSETLYNSLSEKKQAKSKSKSM